MRNVEVATVAGPSGGAYSATIDWGPGDTSTGHVTPLGGDLFAVMGSNPQLYTAAGSTSVTVTVTGPGNQSGTGSSVTDTVNVAPPASSLSNVSGFGTFGAAGTLSATLTAGGKPLGGEPVSFTLTVGSAVENVGSATTNADGVATLPGVNLAGFGKGTYSGVVTARFGGDATHSSTLASGGLTVNVGVAQLVLTNLNLTYDGGPQLATVSTTPPGLGGVMVRYLSNGVVVAAPINVGSYQVSVSLNNPNYAAASVAATLVISPAIVLPAPVTITTMGLTTFAVRSGKKTKKETVLQIQFSGALTASDAGNGAAYQLYSGSTKKKKTVFNSRVKVVSAVYNPQTLTVRLYTAQKLTLAHPLELQINASQVPDIYGRALDGNGDGQPGSNFTGTLSKSGVVLARVMAADVVRN